MAKRKQIQAEAHGPAFAFQSEARFDLAAAADGKAKQPTFEIAAYSGGALRVYGWYRPVVVELSGLRAGPGGRVTVLKDHDRGKIVGQGKATISKTSIAVSGTITGNHSDESTPAGEVVSHAGKGFVWSASIGVDPERVEFVDAGQKVTVNGQEFTGPVNIVRAGRLGEVSFVGIGADENASAKIAASAAEETTMKTFQEWLQAMGLEFDALSEAQRTKLRAKYDAEQKAPPADPPAPKAPEVVAQPNADETIKASREKLAAEAERVAAIGAISGIDKQPAIQAQAIKEGWSIDKATCEVLKANMPKAPAGHVPDNSLTGEVLEAAICLSPAAEFPRKELEARFGEKTLAAADKQFKRGVGLRQLLHIAAGLNGHRLDPFARDVKPLLRAAFVEASGFSTISIAGILANTANKFLLQGFDHVESTWRRIAAKKPVNDFKTVTSYRLTAGGAFQKVAPDGELKHGKLGEESYTNKAETYGEILAVTRQDIINDDLGAITGAPRKLGRHAALQLNTVFWTEFLDNAAFFTAALLNYFEGASSALSMDSLSTAVQKFRDQKDGDGAPAGIEPKILLVPTALEVKAKQLNASLELRDTTASTKYPTANIWAGQFAPAISSYLGNSSFSGYSSTAWYLLAAPEDVPVIEVAFLNGQESPVVESADADFNVLGIQMRGYHDFGVAKQDYRGGVKSKGAA